VTAELQTGIGAPGVPGPAIGRLKELPGVNLMPPEIAERAAMQQVQALCVGAVVISALAVGGLWYHAHSGVSSAQSGLASATQTQSADQSAVNNLAPVATKYAQVAGAKAEVSEALGGEIRWSSRLSDLSLSMPQGVWLTSMSVSTGASGNGALVSTGINSITFAGVAESRNEVAGWLDSLAQENGYVNPYVTSTTETVSGDRILVNFTSTVTGTAGLLSGRYTDQNGS
jgi:Tfp pilus assembly protein PilN